MAWSFEAYLEEARARVDRAVEEVLDRYLRDVDDWLAGPIRYACEDGGKRLRPVLFLAAHDVGVGTADGGSGAERLAVALEIVHAYSLVHDDLPCMDDDDWRRGRATCHRAFGVERATIAAAAMVPLAGWVMASEAAALGLGPAERAALVAELSEAAGPVGMVGGQVLDLASEGRALTREELGELHGKKTGALIRAAVRLGGRAARVDAAALAALTAFGERTGLAFQIADDLLDEAEPPAAEGRDRRSDRALRKATYPGLLGPEAARAVAEDLVDAAIAALHDSGIHSRALEGLARHVIERER